MWFLGSYYNIPKAIFYLPKADYTTAATSMFHSLHHGWFLLALLELEEIWHLLYSSVGPVFWVAVKELNLTYYFGETILVTICTHYGISTS